MGAMLDGEVMRVERREDECDVVVRSDIKDLLAGGVATDAGISRR